MALDKFFENLANGARWDVGVSINRSNALPLDANSVFSSLEAARAYVAGTAEGVLANAYPGQVLAVVTEEETIIYYVDAKNELQPVGNTKDVMAYIGELPEGSSATTIVDYINAKTAGIASDAALKELQDQVTDLDIAVNGKDTDEEGSGKEIPGLVDIVNNGYLDDKGTWHVPLTDRVEINAGAISTEVTNREAAVKAITDSIGTIAEGKTVVKMIEDAEAAAKSAIPTVVSAFTNDANYQNNTQVSNAITAAIAGKANVADVYTKTEIDDKLEDINDTIAGITHFSTKVVSSTDDVTEIGILYLIKDDTVEGVDKYNEYLYMEGIGPVLIGDTTTDLADYATISYVDNKLSQKLDITAYNETIATLVRYDEFSAEMSLKADKSIVEAMYTNDQLDALLNAKADSAQMDELLGNRYTIAEVDDLLTTKADATATTDALATKIETAQIKHTSEGVGEGVTKEGTTLKIVVDSYTKAEVYTKAETDNQIDIKIASVTGGESAADVKNALESYRNAINKEIWGADAESWTTSTIVDGKPVIIYDPKYETTTSRIDSVESDVAILKTNVQTAQTTADNAASAVATLEVGKVATNASKIAAIEGAINNEGGLSDRITTVESDSTTNKAEIATLKSTTATNTGNIATLVGRVDGIDTAISTINGTLIAHTEAIAKKANSADVYTKTEIETKVSDLNTAIGKKADAATTYNKTEVDTAISTAVSNIDTTAIDNNASDIAVLVGSDKDETGRANKSIRAIAADEINSLIKAADPEGGKTIENINNLIAYVDENAGDIAELVSETTDNTAKLAGITDTVVATIDAKIAAAKYVLEVATSEKLGGVKSAKDIVTGEGEETVTIVAENKVYVAEDGVGTVKAVNVNTLVQTENDVLILNGGSASV